MESQYGVQVTNKFNIFLEDDVDPLEHLAMQEEAAKKKKAEAKKEAEKPKGKKTSKKNAAQDPKTKSSELIVPKKEEKLNAPKLASERPRTGGRDRPYREPREPREDGDRRPPRRREDNDANRERPDGGPGGFGRIERSDRPERSEGGFGRGRGGPRRGGTRGGGRGRGGFAGKREFERHSGSDKTSGVKAVDKREGGGSHNWGTIKDDIEIPKVDYWRNPKEQMKESEETPDWNAQTEDTENQDPNESTESGVQEEDSQPKQMTLDEWKKMQEKNRVKSQFNIRKAGEGVDSGQWKKGREYRKSEGDEDEEEEEEDEDDDEDDEDPSKQLINNIRITFNDSPRRGRGGRRPRGPRGGLGGRGSGRGERRGRGDVAPKFDDETDFPRLVKSEA